ncbi:MAG: T9SS type A sorting domain-containing protein, partial [Chlorobi bacterium]|nr:T9SS type A sorting domain-containing protein [Chlorobiota bacterium]
NSTRILTQGFHQSKLSVIGIYDISEDDMQITLFPNPTEKFINLKVSNYDDLSFQLFSFDGKLIKTNKLLSEKTEINMTDLSASIYFLKVLKKNNLIRTYQIIKQ